MKYLLILLLLIIPVSGQFTVEEGDVFTYSILTTNKEYEANAPVKDSSTTQEKAFRVDEITDANITLRMSYNGKTFDTVLANTTFGAEITQVPVEQWAQVADNHDLLSLPEEFDVGGLTISVQDVGDDFSLEVASETVNGPDRYVFYFTLAYDKLSGVRTIFTSTIRHEVNDELIDITIIAETLISTTDPFPKTESRIPVLFLPILFSLMSMHFIRRKYSTDCKK